MIDFILLLIVGACWTWGVHCLFDEGFILNPIREYFRKIGLPVWAAKPLYLCPPCQASFHGTIIALIVYGPSLVVIPYVVCLCGFNYILKSILFPEYE